MGKSNKKHGVAVQGSWLPLPIQFLRSRACASLSLHATKMLVDLMSQLGPNAKNNGNLCAPPELMALRGWTSTASRQAAVAELVRVGLLIVTRYGSRRLCALYAVTLWPLEYDPLKMTAAGPGSYATQDWSTSSDGGADELTTFAMNRKDRPPPAVWSVLRREPAKNENSHPAAGQQSADMTPQRERKAIRTHAIEPVAGSKGGLRTTSVTPPRDTLLDMPSVPASVAPPIPKGKAERARGDRLEFEDGTYLARITCGAPCAECEGVTGGFHLAACPCDPCPKCGALRGKKRCACGGRAPEHRNRLRAGRMPATPEGDSSWTTKH